MTKSGKHCGKRRMLALSNFFFCHYVFKKLSAAEASESVYMRERVNDSLIIKYSWKHCGKWWKCFESRPLQRCLKASICGKGLTLSTYKISEVADFWKHYLKCWSSFLKKAKLLKRFKNDSAWRLLIHII